MNIPVILASVAASMLAAVVLLSSVNPRQGPSRHLSQAERVALFQSGPIVLLGPSSEPSDDRI
jgi:hypothetical protein